MDENIENLLEGMKLRGVIALTARCVRRVFVLPEVRVRECDEAIAMAEAFAAGEPGSPLRARQVADAVHSKLARASYPPRAAGHAVNHLAEAAVSAFSAVVHSPPLEHYCVKAAEGAVSAFWYAKQSLSNAVEEEAGWAREAWRHDHKILRESHA